MLHLYLRATCHSRSQRVLWDLSPATLLEAANLSLTKPSFSHAFAPGFFLLPHPFLRNVNTTVLTDL